MEVGCPSPAKPRVPQRPTTVWITPSAPMWRMHEFCVSAMYSVPSGATSMSVGPLSCAIVAGSPSPPAPGVPVPATVVMVPLGAMRRITWLPVSAR